MAKNLKQSLRALLLADATVSAAVGTRIYPNRAPKKALYPFIVYVLNSETKLDSFSTPSNTLRIANMTYTCYYQEAPTGADAGASAEVLAEAVAAVLEGFLGTVAGGVTIAGTDTSAMADGFFEDEGGDFGEAARAVTLNVWYRP